MKFFTAILFTMIYLNVVAASRAEAFFDFLLFWKDDYKIEYCSGEKFKKNDLGYTIDIKDRNLIYTISDKSWSEGSRRSLSIFRQEGRVFLFDTGAEPEHSCVFLTGDDIDEKLSEIEKITYKFKFSEDSVLEVRAQEGERDLILDDKNYPQLEGQVSQAALDQLNSRRYFYAKKKRPTVFDLNLSEPKLSLFSLTAVYVKASSQVHLTTDQHVENLGLIDQRLTRFVERLTGKEFVNLSADPETRSMFDSLLLTRSEPAATQLELAVKKISFGRATSILRNTVVLYELLLDPETVSRISSDEPLVSLGSLKDHVSNLGLVIRVTLSLSFEPLCRKDHEIKLPFSEKLNGNLVAVFSALTQRALRNARSTGSDDLVAFFEFLQGEAKMGKSYSELVSNPRTKSQIDSFYQSIRPGFSGVPGLRLALGEIHRMNRVINVIDYPALYREYLVSAEDIDPDIEEKAAKAVFEQLKNLQLRQPTEVRVSEADVQAAKAFSEAAGRLEGLLLDKQRSLLEVSTFLQNVNSSGSRLFSQLCP